MSDLLSFCQQLAPEFNWAPMNAFMRQKFSSLDTATFELRYRELLKFLYLRSKYGKGFIPVTVEVDDMWHEFILQTQAYYDLCMALPGKHFIHHNTVALDEYADQRGKDEVITDLLDWIPKYVKDFGPFTEESAQYWMIANFLQEEMQLSLQQMNELAQTH
jgi:hypothetical protein